MRALQTVIIFLLLVNVTQAVQPTNFEPYPYGTEQTLTVLIEQNNQWGPSIHDLGRGYKADYGRSEIEPAGWLPNDYSTFLMYCDDETGGDDSDGDCAGPIILKTATWIFIPERIAEKGIHTLVRRDDDIIIALAPVSTEIEDGNFDTTDPKSIFYLEDPTNQETLKYKLDESLWRNREGGQDWLLPVSSHNPQPQKEITPGWNYIGIVFIEYAGGDIGLVKFTEEKQDARQITLGSQLPTDLGLISYRSLFPAIMTSQGEQIQTLNQNGETTNQYLISKMHLKEGDLPGDCYDGIDNDGDWRPPKDTMDTSGRNYPDGQITTEDNLVVNEHDDKEYKYQTNEGEERYIGEIYGNYDATYTSGKQLNFEPNIGEKGVDCMDKSCDGRIGPGNTICNWVGDHETGRPKEYMCNDGKDNDFDGKPDYADQDCTEQSAGACNTEIMQELGSQFNPSAKDGMDGCCGDDIFKETFSGENTPWIISEDETTRISEITIEEKNQDNYLAFRTTPDPEPFGEKTGLLTTPTLQEELFSQQEKIQISFDYSLEKGTAELKPWPGFPVPTINLEETNGEWKTVSYTIEPTGNQENYEQFSFTTIPEEGQTSILKIDNFLAIPEKGDKGFITPDGRWYCTNDAVDKDSNEIDYTREVNNWKWWDATEPGNQYQIHNHEQKTTVISNAETWYYCDATGQEILGENEGSTTRKTNNEETLGRATRTPVQPELNQQWPDNCANEDYDHVNSVCEVLSEPDGYADCDKNKNTQRDSTNPQDTDYENWNKCEQTFRTICSALGVSSIRDTMISPTTGQTIVPHWEEAIEECQTAGDNPYSECGGGTPTGEQYQETWTPPENQEQCTNPEGNNCENNDGTIDCTNPDCSERNECTTTQIPLPTQHNERFLCNEQPNSQFTECCGGQACNNKVDILKSQIIGTGATHHTIKDYDNILSSGRIEDKVTDYLSAPYEFDIADKELTGFNYLEMYLFTQNTELEITLTTNTAQERYLAKNHVVNYASEVTPGYWWHVMIPINLPNQQLNKISFNSPASADNVALLNSETPNYCSYDGSWTKDLDEIRHALTCNKIHPLKYGGTGWTGTQCCGDDNNPTNKEYYSDPGPWAGCFAGNVITNNNRVGDVINNELYNYLLTYQGEFYACNEIPIGADLGAIVITPQENVKEPFTTYGNWYCDPSGEWKSLGDMNVQQLIAGTLYEIGEENKPFTLHCGEANEVFNNYQGPEADKPYCVLSGNGDQPVYVATQLTNTIQEELAELRTENKYLQKWNVGENDEELPEDYCDNIGGEEFYKACENNEAYKLYHNEEFNILIITREDKPTNFFERLWVSVIVFFERLFGVTEPGLTVPILDNVPKDFTKLYVHKESETKHITGFQGQDEETGKNKFVIEYTGYNPEEVFNLANGQEEETIAGTNSITIYSTNGDVNSWRALTSDLRP